MDISGGKKRMNGPEPTDGFEKVKNVKLKERGNERIEVEITENQQLRPKGIVLVRGAPIF